MSCQIENPAYPAHALDMHEDEDEDEKRFERPTTRKEPLEEGRDQVIDDKNLAVWFPGDLRDLFRQHIDRRTRDHQYEDPTAFLEQEVSGDSRKRADKISIWDKKEKGEVYHMSIA